MKKVFFVLANLVALVSQAGTHDSGNIQMLENQTEWVYTMFSPSLYRFYQEKGGFTYLASEEIVYRVYETQETDGKTNYLVCEELLQPSARQLSDTRAYQGNHLALREEGGRVMVGYDDYKNFLEYGEQFVNASNPSYIPYPKTEEGELILYDFTKQEGDIYAAAVDGHPEIVVKEVDTFIDNTWRECRRLTLSNGCVLIEGIGCINSRGMLLSYLNPREATDDRIFWLSAKADYDYLVYHQDVDVNTLGIADRRVLSPVETNHIGYTLGGIRMTQPQRGLIIKDGKKKLVK
jgi:hypothetical protein